MVRLSATIVEDTNVPSVLKASARATKLTPPPIYEPVIMAATLGNPSIMEPKSIVPSRAPQIVPAEPMRNTKSIRPVSRHIFVMLAWSSSKGMAIGTAYPQTMSSNKGACVGRTPTLTSTRARIRAMTAPDTFEAQA